MASLRMLYWYFTAVDMGKKVATPFKKLARLTLRKPFLKSNKSTENAAGPSWSKEAKKTTGQAPTRSASTSQKAVTTPARSKVTSARKDVPTKTAAKGGKSSPKRGVKQVQKKPKP